MVGVILMVVGGFFSVSIVIPSLSLGGMQSFTFLPVAGVVMGIVGFLTFIVGLAASDTEKYRSQPQQKRYPPFYKKPSTQQPTQLIKTVAICPQCKNRIPTNVKFCPECGLDLRPKK